MNYTLTCLRKLNGSQRSLYLGSLEELSEHAEDIAFRTYDLLFVYYPTLKDLLNKDRFRHPDLACLLSNNEKSIAEGMQSLQYLVDLLQQSSGVNKDRLLPQVRKCLIQAVSDVMYIEASRELVDIYTKLLKQRLGEVCFLVSL